MNWFRCFLLLLMIFNVGCSREDKNKEEEGAEQLCVSWEAGCVPVLGRILAFPEDYTGFRIQYFGYLSVGRHEVEIYPDKESACMLRPGVSFVLRGLDEDREVVERVHKYGVVRLTVVGSLNISEEDRANRSIGGINVINYVIGPSREVVATGFRGLDYGLKEINEISCFDK